MTLLSSTATTWQQLFGLDRILFGFLLLSSSSVFQSGFSSGRTFFKSPNNAKPCSLAAIILRHNNINVIQKMDWRFNTIWFEQLEQDKVFQQDFKGKTITTENKNFESSEYSIIWHLKEKLSSFDNLQESDRLLYLELNWANIKNFDGIEKFKNLKRLELHYCVKLENDKGLSELNDNLEFLHINTSKKFKFHPWSVSPLTNLRKQSTKHF
jgi:hypothetical protein